jgi:membrane dipeptidase
MCYKNLVRTDAARGCTMSMPVAVSTRALELLAAYPSVDVHTHGAATGTLTEEAPSDDLARSMRAGGLAAVCLAECPDWPLLGRTTAGTLGLVQDPAPGALYATHLQRMDWMDQLVAHHGLRRAETVAEVRASHADGQPTLIQTIEGLDFLDGEVGRLEADYRRGVRVMQLVHYIPTDLGDRQTDTPTHRGLSDLGAAVIRECNRLGVVVDVAHASADFVTQAAAVATRPLLLSHTAVAASAAMGATRLTARQISQAHAHIVADTDGTIGVWHFFPDLPGYVAGIKEMVDFVGVDHVSVGSDQQVNPGSLQDYGDFGRLVDALFEAGFGDEDVAKLIGTNFLRVFARATGEA